MANTAEVLVKNVFTGDSIRVIRKPTPNDVDLDKTVAANDQQQVNLQSPDVLLVIEAPTGKDIKTCQLKVDAAVDLEVIASRTNSYWTVKIVPNEIPPDIPTTVNISLGDVE
jgi:hypothetical protein